MIALRRPACRVLCAVLTAVCAPAWAQDPPDAGAPGAGEVAEVSQPQPAADVSAVEDELREELEALREDLAQLREGQRRLFELSGRVTGYMDIGFFAVGGDGSGIRTDLGHRAVPALRDVPDSWTFLGDPLSTAVNSRGEPADTGESRAVVFDSIDSRGRPTFLLNAVGLGLYAGIGDDVVVKTLVDFVPRGRDIASADGAFFGDFIDVKLAYARYSHVTDRLALHLYAGKLESTVGLEYRTQEAPDRLGITPSLSCRYVCGHPLGVKLRAESRGRALGAALSVTNGSHFIEGFPLSNEVDRNNLKTVSGNLLLRPPAVDGLELGASGAIGAQDGQPDDGVLQWHYGFHAQLDRRQLIFSAEFVTGRALGAREEGGAICGVAPCLFYRSAYGRVGYRATTWLIPYLRIDWRDALHRDGLSYAYVSRLIRATAGVQTEIGARLMAKAEYIFNVELDPVPLMPNDVFTTSVVVKF